MWAVDRNEIIVLTTPLEDFLERFTYATPEFGLLIAAPLAMYQSAAGHRRRLQRDGLHRLATNS